MKRIFVYIIFICFFTQHIRAQLYGVNADYQTWINYTGGNKIKARVFVFNQNPLNWDQKKGTLKAIAPDSTNGWKFQWSILDLNTFEFRDTLNAIDNADSAYLQNLQYGCYKVRMKKGEIDTTFYAWIIINKLRFFLIKNAEGNVKEFEYSCDFLDLRAVPRNDIKFDPNLRYYHDDYFLCPNPETGDLYRLNNELKCTWTGSDGSTYVTSRPQIRIYNPPAQDTKYTVQVTDVFGNTASDHVTYKSINTKADFKIYIAEDTISGQYQRRYKETNEGEAKLWAKFVNTSKNGARFTWKLSDLYITQNDSIYYNRFTTDSTDTITDVIYYYPRTYKVLLISESPWYCTDTSYKELIVKPSKMGDLGKNALPKVFTPNNDGFNDYFYIKTDDSDSIQSMESLNLRVFNSRGKKVYEYNGKIADGWKGWDGKTYWGLEAPAGIYYYYFEAKGYGPLDKFGQLNANTKYIAPQRVSGKGFFYLFR